MRLHPPRSINQDTKATGPKFFDYASKLGFPIAFVIIAQLQTREYRLWGAIWLALLSFLVGFSRPTVNRVRHSFKRRRDAKTARASLSELRRFVVRFGEFIENNRDNTLEAALRELFRGNPSAREKLQVVSENLFRVFLLPLRNRLANPRQHDIRGFEDAISELNDLVNAYLYYCVRPVYDDLPPELRSLTGGDAGKALRAVRERILRFLDDYEEFLKRLETSLLTVKIPNYSFKRPNPI